MVGHIYQGIHLFLLGFIVCLEYRFLKYVLSLNFLCAYCNLFLFIHSLLMWIFSLFWFIWLEVCLSCWIFSMNQLFISSIFVLFLFLFHWFQPGVWLFCLVYSFWVLYLLVLELWVVLLSDQYCHLQLLDACTDLPLRNTIIVSCRCGYVMLSFSFSFNKF